MDSVHITTIVLRPNAAGQRAFVYIIQKVADNIWEVDHMGRKIPLVYLSSDDAIKACDHHNQTGIWLLRP